MKHLILILIVALAVGCNSSDPSENTAAASVEVEIDGLELNNGEKWTANPETEDGMQAMKQQISNFTASGAESYQALGNDLSDIANQVIQKCDMKGKPHDQLHLVLLPMLEEIKNLKATEQPEEGAKALQQLEALLEQYFAHFEVEG